MVTYKTRAGQLWDEVAFEIYGDCRYVSNLMDANRDKLEYFAFPAGVELVVPEISTETVTTNLLPAWYQ